VQALGLAGHVTRVVATDLNERAVWATRVSAALSGVHRIEVRVGDGLEPVADERFDLVVSNPPFVISPAAEVVFRDAETRGDTLSRSLVRGVVDHLQPGGVACVLVNWIVQRGEPVAAAAETWLADLPVKALLLQHEVLDPVAYAQRWSLLPTDATIEEHRLANKRWIAELERLGAASVVSGAVILERTDAPGSVRVARMQRRPADGGQQVRRMLDAVGRFDGPDASPLKAARFQLVHGHRIAELLEAVFRFDEAVAVGQVAAELAVGRGQPAAELEATLRPVVLELFELGFLEVIGGA